MVSIKPNVFNNMKYYKKPLNSHLRLFFSPFANGFLRHFSDLTLNDIKALIPKRIERGPTDVLKALSQTYKRDPTAFDYKFMDDPYFYPLTSNAKRIHSLSMESGRKSARWIVKKYPQLFDHTYADPFIKALAPKIEYNEESNVDEKTLLMVIQEKNVSDAINVYSLLKKKNIEISNDTKQLLLELVCFYNCEKLFDPNDTESNWYRLSNSTNVLKTWKDKGFAEMLFKEMNVDCPLAYSTLIQGMLKYGQVKEAINLYKTAQEKNLNFTIGVYNGLIENATTIYQNSDEIWNYIIDILYEMKNNQLEPNLYTLNATLKVINNMRNYGLKRRNAFAILKEFASIGVKPSLGTHYYILRISCSHKEESRNLDALKRTLRNITIKKWEIQHEDDIHFFRLAMRLCESFKDIESAHFVRDLFLENNHDLLGGAIQHNAFHKSYLSIIFEEEPIEIAMKFYKELVPQTYNAEIDLFMNILSAIKANETFEFLPAIWNDIQLFFNLEKKSMLGLKVLSLTEVWDGKNEEVSSIFKNVADMWFSDVEKEAFFNFSEDLSSNLMITYLKLKNFDNALVLLNMASEKKNFTLNFNAVENFFDFCLTNDKKDHIVPCLKVAEAMDHRSIGEMAEKALNYLGEENENSEWFKKLIKNAKPKSSEEEVTEKSSEFETKQ